MRSSLIILLICLILVLAIIILIGSFIRKIQRKAEQFSRVAFGTSSLTEGVRQMQSEYAATPKSVSGMTSLYLPKITADFPDFHYDEMKERAQNVLSSYLLAVDRMDTSKMEGANEELCQQLENYIMNLKGCGRREHFKNLKIHRTEISNYQKKQGRCIITFQSAIQYYHYVTDEAGTVIEGRSDVLFQSKYDVDLIYIQNRELVMNELDYALGVNCPNCGAPLQSLGAKVCEYCGTPVMELNIHAWSFSAIREK